MAQSRRLSAACHCLCHPRVWRSRVVGSLLPYASNRWACVGRPRTASRLGSWTLHSPPREWPRRPSRGSGPSAVCRRWEARRDTVHTPRRTFPRQRAGARLASGSLPCRGSGRLALAGRPAGSATLWAWAGPDTPGRRSRSGLPGGRYRGPSSIGPGTGHKPSSLLDSRRADS
jgi:hypothetical protein